MGRVSLGSWAESHLTIRCPLFSNSWKIAFILLVNAHRLDNWWQHVDTRGSIQRVFQLHLIICILIYGHVYDCCRSDELVHDALLGVDTA